MFSLIISIISIALVAALALASIYYGGEAFNKGTSDADASTIINQGQQLQAAMTVANVDRNAAVTSIATLTDQNYLQEIPAFEGVEWAEINAVGDPYAVVAVVLKDDVCDAINAKAGLTIEEDNSERELAGSESIMFGCNSIKNAYYKVGSPYDAGTGAPG